MMISPGIEAIGLGVYMHKFHTLIINDLHFGYEFAQRKQGVLLPKTQHGAIKQQLKEILGHRPVQTVVINGDLKHNFGHISDQEWSDINQLFDQLKAYQVVVIQGNHDPLLPALAKKCYLVQEYKLGHTLITHGDRIVQTTAKRIIIGHLHPAITLQQDRKIATYKCYLAGRWQEKDLIVVPSFNPLIEGLDFRKHPSPYLHQSNSFSVYAVSQGEIFALGSC